MIIASQQLRRRTMKFRARMIVTMAAVALLVPACLLAADGSTNPSTGATAVDSTGTPDAVDNAELAAGLATAQSGAPAMLPRRADGSYPRVELFLGYSYLRGVPTLSPGNRMDFLNGGSASIAFNLNRYLGLVGDFGGFDASELQLTGAGANPARVSNASGTAFTYMAGPRLSFRKYDRITPFAQVLFGGIHASQVTLSGCAGALCTPLPTENSFALTAGGGIDLRVHRHIDLRLVQAEYLMTNFANLSTGKRDTQNDIRLSSGLVFGFGGIPPLPPVTYSCSIVPASGYPGDPITVTGSAMNLNPKKTPTYTWISTGGTISGTSNTANIATTTAAPGTYTVTGHVTEGPKPGQSADCTGQFAINAFQPPTISCSANPSSVNSGDSSTITASATSPQNRPLTYSYSATAGAVSGSSSSATLSTVGASPGPIAVTCNVVDDKGNTASSTTSVGVSTPPPPPQPPAPMASSLCTVSFEHDAKRPTRVDNEAKACLDDVALVLQHSSDAQLALVGNTESKESATKGKKMSNYAAERAVNTKDYLVTEKGIDPSRIMVYTGTDDAKTVTTTLVPAGATNPAGSDTPVDENAVKAVRRTGR
jgi:outer membrane protein OmpA-like peptidoglycan-associated protein